METKLRRLIIGTFAGTFVLLVLMIVLWNMVLIRPLKENITTAQANYDKQKTEAGDLKKSLANKVKAEKNLMLVQDQLKVFRQRFRSINFDLTTPAKTELTWKGYMTEYSREYGIALRDEIVAAADDAGVDVATSAKIDAPPQKPEDVVAPAGFLKPVTGGNLSVTIEARSYNDLLRFLTRINKSRILMTVGNIKLAGYAPAIKASVTLTPYLITTGPSVQLPEPVSAAAATVDAGAAAVKGAVQSAAETVSDSGGKKKDKDTAE